MISVKPFRQFRFSQSLAILPLMVFITVGWSSATTLSQSVRVSMDYAAPYYSPAQAVVPDGSSIQILNSTSSPHTLTHNGCQHSHQCEFDTGVLHPGEEFVLPSLPPGRYSYYCVLHPIMQGEIIVLPQNP